MSAAGGGLALVHAVAIPTWYRAARNRAQRCAVCQFPLLDALDAGLTTRMRGLFNIDLPVEA
jgi:hypothetical protein